MKLAFIEHDKLYPDKANMRYAKKAPDVSDLLPTVRKRGVMVPLVVRPSVSEPDRSGIVAGLRSWTAYGIVLAEDIDHGPLPCAILEDGGDADAIETSLIENIARLAPDEVTRWETFARLVREGREVEDIFATFGIPEQGVKRILALGNLLPRIRDLYRKEKINAATVRQLTLASKSQQKAWLVLYDDPDAYCPTGHQLKDWLFGGASIRVENALFDVEKYRGGIIAEAKRLERGEAIASGPKVPRPEVTSAMQTYIDLHRHAAVRAALYRHPKVGLRLMVAHAIVGSSLWTVKIEEQATRNDEVRESVETCKGETDFDAKRRAVLDLLNFSAEEPTVTGGNGDPHGLVGLFLALLPLSDHAIMQVVTIVMGETLGAGSAAVEAVGDEIGVDMARYWQADDAFFELIRDKEVLTAIVAEVAGEDVARANAKEPGKVLKRIVRDHLDGANGRPKVDGWVPKWMVFPPAAYTTRGGVGTVSAHAKVVAARADHEPEPTGPGSVIALPAPVSSEREKQPEREAA
nr:ParB N-terminal domain-containing protein [Sphingomonas sp. Y57]